MNLKKILSDTALGFVCVGDHEHGHGPGDETHEGGGRHDTVGARTSVPNRHGLETFFKYTSCIHFCSPQIAIQMTLLGWLFIADILDNPYGFNVDYDKNLEEVSIYKYSYISNYSLDLDR